jgi:hypothetical protein
MIEIKAREFACILPLLAGIKQKVLPYAICEEFNPGRVFVDHRGKPRTALIWTPVGYYFLVGKPSQAVELIDIREVLTKSFIPASKATGETGFIHIASDEDWKTYLPALLPNREVIEIYRHPFSFSLDRFNAQGDWRTRIPHGLYLHAVDATLASLVGVLASWASVEDFVAKGMGFALLDGQKIASVCTSVFVSNKLVEIDVKTDDNYQRRG